MNHALKDLAFGEIDFRNKYGKTAFDLAASDEVKELLRLRGGGGTTALMIAAMKDDIAQARELLNDAKGQSLSASSASCAFCDGPHWTPEGVAGRSTFSFSPGIVVIGDAVEESGQVTELRYRSKNGDTKENLFVIVASKTSPGEAVIPAGRSVYVAIKQRSEPLPDFTIAAGEVTNIKLAMPLAFDKGDYLGVVCPVNQLGAVGMSGSASGSQDKRVFYTSYTTRVHSTSDAWTLNSWSGVAAIGFVFGNGRGLGARNAEGKTAIDFASSKEMVQLLDPETAAQRQLFASIEKHDLEGVKLMFKKLEAKWGRLSNAPVPERGQRVNPKPKDGFTLETEVSASYSPGEVYTNLYWGDQEPNPDKKWCAQCDWFPNSGCATFTLKFQRNFVAEALQLRSANDVSARDPKHVSVEAQMKASTIKVRRLLSLSLSLSLSLCVCVPLSLSLSLSLSVPLSLSTPRLHSVSDSHPHALTLSLSPSLTPSLSRSLPLSLSPSLPLSLSHSLALSLSYRHLHHITLYTLSHTDHTRSLARSHTDHTRSLARSPDLRG